MMCNCQELSKEMLLQEINKVSFAVDDILLYLDTHPCDKEALDFYQENASKRKRLMEEYARSYGPLTIDCAQASCLERWQWAEQPFPWEMKGGCR